MSELFLACGSALWLGILTSVSPCPLATNVAAIAFVSKKATHPALVFLSSLAYTLGRMVAYAFVGSIIVSSLASVPQVAQFLQKYAGKALGPLLVFTGLVLLGLIRLSFPRFVLSIKHQTALAESGAPGAFILGFIFALAFCPSAAALFFGSLIPLALSSVFGVMLTFVYGIGTGLPVLAFAVALACGVSSLSHLSKKVAACEGLVRIVTGVIFLAVGLYYVWMHWL